QKGKRLHACAGWYLARFDDGLLNDTAVSDLRIPENGIGTDHTIGADTAMALDVAIRPDHRILADDGLLVDVRRFRINQRTAGFQPAPVRPAPERLLHSDQLRARTGA